jgi:hypothetical protein
MRWLLLACGLGAASCQTPVQGVTPPTDSGMTPGDSGSTPNGVQDAGGTDSGSTDSGALADGGALKSSRRGIAYDFASPADLAAVSPGVGWWYNWGAQPNPAVPTDWVARYGMDYLPMLWNGTFNSGQIETFLQAHPEIQYLLVLNEPNLTTQSNTTPQAAAQLWPQYEAVSAATGVKIVGPAITWGTMTNYEDPVAWLDAFIAAYQSANSGRSPQIDALAFHWYDYGLAAQLDRLDKYGKEIWVTEFANWHSQDDGAQIDTLAKQEAQMMDMVNTCETRSDVGRYAWFSGRVNPDPHFSSLLADAGELTPLGALYLSLP